MYFLMLPMIMSFLNEDYMPLIYGLAEFGPERRVLIMLMGLLSLIGFYVGLELSGYRLVIPLKSSQILRRMRQIHLRRVWHVLFSVWCVTGFVLFAFYWDILFAQSDYTAAYGITYNSPLFSFVKMHYIISSCLMASLAITTKNKWTFLLCLGFLGLSTYLAMVTSDKDPLLLVMLALATILTKFKLTLFKLSFVATIGFLSVLLLMPLFSLYRSNAQISEVLPLLRNYAGIVTKVDPAGPMFVLSSKIDSTGDDFSYGVNYTKSLGILIPKLVWPERPLDPAEEFARENIPNWSPGQGLGYSPLAEAYVNFGIVGVFLQYFVMAFLLGTFLRFIQRNLFKYYREVFISFSYVIVFFILTLSFRGPSISVLKGMLMFCVPYCVILYLYRPKLLIKRPLGNAF